MAMNINPFVLSPAIPDELFCDRQKESASLMKSIINQENVVLISPRRVGKTGLIYHCFNQSDIHDNYVTVSIDILHTTSFQEFLKELGTAVFNTIAKRSEYLTKLFVTTLRSLSGSFGLDPVTFMPTFDIKLGQITMPEYTLDEIFTYVEKADKPCIVAYPLLRGTDGNVRPFLYSGLFVGDESHRPGRVIWEGSSSVYTPSDSIFAESDSTAIRELFDPETHALKNVYFYWNAVHPQPNPTAETNPKAYSTTVFSIQPTELAQPTTFAKVASTFWSVRPVVPKIDGMKQYWEKDSAFYYLKRDRYSDNDGVLYKNGNYCFCLLDGGDNIKRVAERTDDANGNKRWTDAVSQSMKVIGLNKWLPTVVQSQSITKMLGNRMSIFYNRYTKDRNMLGLDWPTGYWVISHPEEKTMATVHTQNDGQGMPIVTNDKEQMCIMRLSGSGTDLLLSFPEYVRSFNYSDQLFFKFFPIYITTDTF
jgi:hypothetical protein